MSDELTPQQITAEEQLLADLHKNPVRPNLERIRKFAGKHKINVQTYPQIEEWTTQQLEEIEKLYPDIAFGLERLYKILQIEKKEVVHGTLSLGKFFEPIYWFFALIFKLFIRVVTAFVSRREKTAKETGK